MPRLPKLEGKVERFSVSLPPDLLARLDAMVADQGMPSRSQAIAEMINQQLIEHYQQDESRVLAGTVTIVYAEDGDQIRRQLAAVERRYKKEVISSQHVFLEENHSLEVLLVQGPSAKLRSLREKIVACRGVRIAKLTITTEVLPPLH
jgi:CopG family transcriptional regulator, nickel-responsive regulator